MLIISRGICVMTRFFRLKHKVTPQAWRQLVLAGSVPLEE